MPVGGSVAAAALDEDPDLSIVMRVLADNGAEFIAFGGAYNTRRNVRGRRFHEDVLLGVIQGSPNTPPRHHRATLHETPVAHARLQEKSHGNATPGKRYGLCPHTSRNANENVTL
jgi:hypothetical protein